jgi:Right handed beta helix region
MSLSVQAGMLLGLLMLVVACQRKNCSFGDDAAADDTKALQAAINQCNGTLSLANKVYRISASLSLHSDLVIKGNMARIIMSSAKPFNLFNIIEKKNVSISDLNIVGLKPAVTTQFQCDANVFIVHIFNSSNIGLTNINCSQHAFTPFHFQDAKEVRVSNCTFSNLGLPISTDSVPYYSYDGIFIGGYTRSENIKISGCRFENISGAWPRDGGYGNDGDGIQIQGTGENVVKNVTITNCHFENCTRRGIKAQSGYELHIENNTFVNCRTGVGLSLVHNVAKIQILNNRFRTCMEAWGTNADKGERAAQIIFSGNTILDGTYVFRRSGSSIVRNVVIRDNKADGLKTFFVDGLLYDTKIENNEISNFGLSRDPSLYMAILIAEGSENVEIINNKISSSVNTRCAIYIQDKTRNINIRENSISLPLSPNKDEYIIHFSEKRNREVLKTNKVKLSKD